MKNRMAYALLVPCLIILFSVAFVPSSSILAAADCSVPYRIMPVGDSITQGAASGVDSVADQIGYRKTLYELLTRSGYYVDFVGTQTAGENYTSFDPHHEGHPGKGSYYFVLSETGSLNSRLYDYADFANPDIVLLHIGTNDMQADGGNPEIGRYVTRVNWLLDELQLWEDDNSKNVPVIMAEIIQREVYDQDTTDFNDQLRTDIEDPVTGRIAVNGDDITYVNMEDDAGIVYDLIAQGGDMWDNLHPFSTGYDKMANLWYPTLITRLTPCMSFVSTPPTTFEYGTEYATTITASTALPSPSAFIYSLETAPVGMTIDPNSGLISWTPAALGMENVMVRATVDQIDAGDNNRVRTISQQQAFSINVVDTTPPLVTLNGAAEITLEAGTAFIDPGATATDIYDGDLTGAILYIGSVDTSTVGVYELSYEVSDSSGNVATATRTVNVVDTTAPDLTLLGNDLIIALLNSTFVDPGATAVDIVDGDLTASIMVSGTVDTSVPGDYVLTYSVTDSSGNNASTTRSVTVVDTQFTLTDSLDQATVYVDARWIPIDGASYYQLYIADAMGNPVVDTWNEAAAVCDALICNFRPGVDLLPFGLFDGEYSATLNAYIDANGSIAEVGAVTLVVDTPAPAEPQLTAVPNQGQPTLTWTNDPTYTQFYQVLIVSEQGEIVYLEWHPRMDVCNGATCTLTPAIYPEPGAYLTYIQPFGPGGFVDNDLQGWVAGGGFTIPDAPPAAPTDLSATDNGDGTITFTWQAGEGTLFYQFWAGTLEPVTTVHTLWYTAQDLGCANGGTCTLTPDESFSPGATYHWYIQPFGPGGFIQNDIQGWIAGPEFSR